MGEQTCGRHAFSSFRVENTFELRSLCSLTATVSPPGESHLCITPDIGEVLQLPFPGFLSEEPHRYGAPLNSDLVC